MIKKIISIKLRYDKYREKGKRENKMNYEKLLEPIKVGNHIWRNRIVMHACETRLSNPDGSSSREMADYYGERAKGGAAAIIVENTFVDNKESRSSLVSSGMYNDHMIASHYYVSQAIKEGGADAILQISHGGRQANAGATGLQCVGPSAIPCKFVQRQPRALSKEEIIEIEDCFAAAAVRAKMAGFDGVEIHGAHGYLICSFLSPYTNHRTDEYGGTLENRMRFTLECIEAIKKNVPDTMPVLVKFTPHQRVEGFRTIDEGIEMAKILEKARVDALHVDTGCYEEWFQAITTVYSKEGYKLDVQKAIKDVVSVPVLGDGNLKDPEVAKKAVEDGILDYVGLAHQMLADPYWPKKVKAHHEEDIAPCVGCNECLLAGFSGKHYYCAVNPLCYAEKAYALPLPNGQKRNVLVIGGGPAGMMAAITAKHRGFDVDLYEKENKLGGTLWPAGGPDFKADVLKLIKYLETQCQKLGVNIHLNTAITKDNLEGDYDKVILAAGSTPAMPPITGIDTTVLASDYLTHQATVGKKVVVIGAGLAGTEAACDIAGKDGDVTLVEMCPDILFTANHCLNNDQHLRKMVKDRGVKVEANAKVTNITPTSVTFERDGQTMTLECDTVLNAVGFRPNNQLEDLLDEKYDEVAVIGDAVAPRKILTAIHEGYHAIRVME